MNPKMVFRMTGGKGYRCSHEYLRSTVFVFYFVNSQTNYYYNRHCFLTLLDECIWK